MTGAMAGTPRYVVYTAIFGDYDSLHDPAVTSPNVRFICFTDNQNLHSEAWELVYVAPSVNATDLNRRYKINPHLYLPKHEYSLYVDGNVRIQGHLDSLFEKYSRISDIAVPRHSARVCTYEEAEMCLRNGRGNSAAIQEAIVEYRRAGFPAGAGLYECNILFRRTFEPNVVRLMESWWAEYNKGAGRDQISFPFVAWMNGIAITELTESPRYSRKVFRLGFHNGELALPPFRKALLFARLNRHNSVLFGLIADAADRLAAAKPKLSIPWNSIH